MSYSDTLIASASKIAHENGHARIEPAHLFKVILRKDGNVRPFLEETLKKDYWYLVDWVDIRIGQVEKGSGRGEFVPSKAALSVLHEAENYQSQAGLDEMDDRCVHPWRGILF